MNNLETTHRITFPAWEIQNLDQFEKARAQAYGEARGNIEQLTQIVEQAKIKDTETSLYDSALDQLTEAENDPSVKVKSEAEARARRIGRALHGVEYVLEIGEDLKVHDIFKLVQLPEDKTITGRAKQISLEIPYGPKQNRSSFRTR